MFVDAVVKEGRVSLWYIFEEKASKHPDATCIWARERNYTWSETRTLAVQYAQWFLSQGVRPNQLVAFYLINQPELIIAWFGLWCIGCAPAFINYNLEGAALEHCLQISEAKVLLVEEDEACQTRVARSRENIESKLGIKIHVLNSPLKHNIASLSSVSTPSHSYRAEVQGSSPLCLFYTSGTTGLPKASAFTISRLRLSGTHLAPHFNGQPGPGGDRWYVSMPMYHATGGVTSLGSLLQGLSLAVGRRFSVSNFWKDVHDSEATFFVYVGETARYLLNARPDPWERRHKIRCAYGNGLRPDVWDRFKERFQIPEIVEFFNSTEGMFVLINWDRGGWQGACVGHHGLILRGLLHNLYVPVLIDHGTGDIFRHPKTGFAKRTKYEEGGEIIVKVPDMKAFQGYWNSEEATEKKFVRDVFKKGDIYYRTGDALRRLPDGRWYFMDRLGDTFRWKSENVSTAEVALVLGQFPGIVEANVYGVLVPNHEGRAGCAALFVEDDKKDAFDYNALLSFAKARLPKYAVPVFIRVVNASSHIHNLKQNKVLLRKEGVDPAKKGFEAEGGMDDVILCLKKGLGRGEGTDSDAYVKFTEDGWRRLEIGETNL
jgi:acyl-CoA synthetase (AMP-forming)/AMP-acid ligase II